MKTFFSLVSGLLFAFPSFAQTTATQSIPLASGWNLLVLQIQPTNPNPASVFDSLGVNFAAAWTFDNATRQWSRFARPGTMEATNNSIFSMAELQIGRGYWVYMNAPATWNLTGQIPAVSPPVLMTNGWNLVGIPTGRVPLPESVSMLSVLTAAGFDYDTILKWESGLYRKFTPADTDVDDFTLFDPNRGYWVRVKSGGTFSLQPRLLSSVRADVDVEPQGNYPSFEDLQISPSPVPLNPSNQTHIVFLSGEDTQQIAIANTGGGMLAWDIQWQPSDATNINWLQFSSVSGITTIENDVVQIFLDRTQLPKGTYTGTLVLRTSAGNRSFQVVANVGDLRGEWRGVAKISNVNGRHNEVADIDLHVDFFGDPTTPGLIRGLLDSRNSLLWPLDVPLVGHSGSLSENRITLGGAFILPPGDLNNPPYATFATGADLEDVDWNCNGTLDDINPYPFPLYRSVLLQGKLVSSSASEGLLVSGDYVETVYGMLRTPIRLEGTFTLRRENPKPFSNRRPVANVEDSNGVQPVVYKSFAPGSPLNIPVGLTTNSLSFITDLALQNISVDVDFGDAPASGVKFTLESPSGQQVILHNQANLGTLRSMSFPSLRNPVQSFDALINSGSPTRGNWKLIIQNSSGIGGKLYFWSLTLQGQPVFTVSGRVVDATTGAGIPGQVSLDGLPITAATVAGADGSFTFSGLPGIPVNFAAGFDGYAPSDPSGPGLSPGYVVPTYGASCSNQTRQAYLSKFRPLPAMPVPPLATDGFSNYGSSTNPVVLNLSPRSDLGGGPSLLASPSTGFGPLEVNLTLSGNTNAIPPASSIAWNFGDGSTTNGINLRNLQHIYSFISPTGFVVTAQFNSTTLSNYVQVMPSPGNSPYTMNFFQLQFTGGGTIPANLLLSITGSNNPAQPPAFADLVMVQHADCASFDIDRAPFTTPGNRNFHQDGFTNGMLTINSADYANGFKGEDDNYQVTLAQWSLAGDCAYLIDDDQYNPHPKPGFTGDCALPRYRMLCNLGPQILPPPNAEVYALSTNGPPPTVTVLNPDPLLAAEKDQVGKVRDVRLITGPLAAFWKQ